MGSILDLAPTFDSKKKSDGCTKLCNDRYILSNYDIGYQYGTKVKKTNRTKNVWKVKTVRVITRVPDQVQVDEVIQIRIALKLFEQPPR